MTKVYCKDCAYRGQSIMRGKTGYHISDHHCEHPNNIVTYIIKDYYSDREEYEHKKYASQINKKNNCKDYKKRGYYD